MTTSYSITRDAVVVASLRKLGVIEPIDTVLTVDTSILTNANLVFNLMVKQWMTDGMKIWTVQEVSVPLTVNKTTYTMGPGMDVSTDRPLRCIQAFLRNTSVTPYIDIPMTVLSQQEYNTYGSKFSTGVTNSIYLEVGLTYSTVKIFLTPDINTSTNYVLHMVVQRPISDMNASSDVPDFPQEWYNALVWGLADELAIEFSVPNNHRQEITQRAMTYKERLMDWDQEYVPTFFSPDIRTSINSYR